MHIFIPNTRLNIMLNVLLSHKFIFICQHLRNEVLERSNSQVSYNYFNKEAAAIFKESDPNICGLSLGDTMVSNTLQYLLVKLKFQSVFDRVY